MLEICVTAVAPEMPIPSEDPDTPSPNLGKSDWADSAAGSTVPIQSTGRIVRICLVIKRISSYARWQLYERTDMYVCFHIAYMKLL